MSKIEVREGDTLTIQVRVTRVSDEGDTEAYQTGTWFGRIAPTPRSTRVDRQQAKLTRVAAVKARGAYMTNLGSVALSIWLIALLTGCTFTPVYRQGSDAPVAQISFSYATTDSRIEQVIYQTLSLSFAASDSALLTLDVAARAAGAKEAMSQVAGRNSEVIVTITAYATITRGGERVIRFERSASAAYTTGLQVLANKAAEENAQENAARSVAESIRLAILAAAPQLAQ